MAQKQEFLALLKDGEIREALAGILLDAAKALSPKPANPASCEDDLDFSKIVPSWTVGHLKQQLVAGEISDQDFETELPKREALQKRTYDNLRRAQTAQFSDVDALWLAILPELYPGTSKGATLKTAFVTYRRRNRREHKTLLTAVMAKHGLGSLEETFLALLEGRISN